MSTRIANTAEARSVNRDERTVDVVASTFAVDSYGTRIDPNGWDLDQFKKNPVITWAHDDRGHTASGGRPIAKAENIRVEDGKLKMRLRFPDKGKFRFADEVFDLLADGFLNAVSVGFDPIEYRDEKSEENGDVRIYTRSKLLEVAVVTVPSNDEALAERAKRMNANEEEVRTRAQRIEEMAKELNDADEAFTLRIGETEIRICVWQGEAESFVREFDKVTGYFERKQPANRAATKAMEKFYKKILDEDQPEDEVKAWERMAEAIEAMEETEEPVKETPEEKPEEKVEEETITPPTPPAEEAPQPAQEAPVQLSLDVLAQLPGAISQACFEAVVKASRQGVPPSEWDGIIDATGNQFLRALSISKSSK